MTSRQFENVINEIKEIDKLCTPCIASAEKYSYLLKDLYDSSVDILFKSRNKKLGPVTQFVIIGLDEESIWEELQTRNKPLLRYIKKITLKLLKNKRKNEDKIRLDSRSISEENLLKDIESKHKNVKENNRLITYDDDDDDDEGDDIDDDDGNDYNNPNNELDSEDQDNEIHIENDDRIDVIDKSENELDVMEAWLDEEEKLEEKRNYKLEKLQKKYEQKRNLEESDSEEEEGLDDMFFVQENLYDDDASDNDNNSSNKIHYRYNDFFANEGNSSTRKSNGSKNLNEDADEEIDERSSEEEDNYIEDYDGVDDYVDDSIDDSKHNMKSQEPKKSHLMLQIGELEKDLVAPKPWELRGEVKASDRPENSFLSLSADIERISKPAPVVTQEFTSSLEDMICKRIKDGIFNDVKLKEEVKPRENNTADVSQEKSKMGLGEIYAEEFLAKSLNSQPEVVSKRLESDREELQNLFHKVSLQLDALSHFHFTPRPIVSDSKISSLPAISSLLLEDVTPSVFANSGIEQSMLAPEEVFNKKRGKAASLMSENELTADDKKRIRKASKHANKAKKNNNSSADGESVRAKKDEKDLENQLKRDNRVILANDGNSKKKKKSDHTGSISYSKSESFFANLQKLTENHITL